MPDPSSYSPMQQQKALWLSTTAFTLCFAVWTIFSIIGITIKQELGLTEFEYGVLIATPILTGSLIRLILGVWTERYGGRLVFSLQMLFTGLATWALTWADSYATFLLAALGVGMAGGSFIIGVAYVSKWFPAQRQGTALGIFGMGNVGAAVTKFIAPFILVAWGWQAVAQIWAVGIALMGVVFLLVARDDPDFEARRAQGIAAPTLAEQFAPLRNLQVWRFALYYFFVFGGFVALALWLPKYYIAEYGLDLKTASFITMLFTLPSGLIRALGGWFSDSYGARAVNWGVFWVCLVCLFFLSYPQTTMTIHGIQGDLSLGVGLNVWLFTFLVFVVGIAQGFGKASVYRIIHDYYPQNMGTVGGMVGVIGGLGGFCLPILFGYAADHIGVRSSCFMLLFGLTIVCMVWMHYAIKQQRRLDGRAQTADVDLSPLTSSQS